MSQKLADFHDFFSQHKEPAFRSKQVCEWIWKKHARSFRAMSNIPSSLRSLLDAHFYFEPLRIEQLDASTDLTTKVVFLAQDDQRFEGVLIPAGNRVTACISSQVGCPLGCKFCATGLLGFRRNLMSHEIYDQVILLDRLAQEQLKKKLSNIVIMGMGEPLLNDEEVIKAIRKWCDPEGAAISPQRITLSTVGIPEGIRRLASAHVKIQLAVSLHSASQHKRETIIPAAKKFTLLALSEALEAYYRLTRQRIVVEYLMLKDVNDSIQDARELAAFCKRFPVKINLIEYNRVDKTGFERSSDEKMEAIAAFLKRLNMVVNIRKSRGEDIAAACGQLALRNKKT